IIRRSSARSRSIPDWSAAGKKNPGRRPGLCETIRVSIPDLPARLDPDAHRARHAVEERLDLAGDALVLPPGALEVVGQFQVRVAVVAALHRRGQHVLGQLVAELHGPQL